MKIGYTIKALTVLSVSVCVSGPEVGGGETGAVSKESGACGEGDLVKVTSQ